MSLEGGCLCGSVRYRLDAEPFDAGYCHCETCRRSAGAPVLVFACVATPAFVVTQGSPRRWRSSESGERWFCGDCGSQLAMHVDYQPATIAFTIATLDDPATVPPGFHIWTKSRIAWFDIADTLPRSPEFRPETQSE